MGNRGFVTTENGNYGIYFHWNGGRDSIEAFVKYAKLTQIPCPHGRYADGELYSWQRFATLVENAGFNPEIQRIEAEMKNETGRLKDDYWGTDNGIYYLKDWEIVGRAFQPDTEQNEYDLQGFLQFLDESQPIKKQLGLGKDTEKPADHSGDTAPKDTAPVKDTPQDTEKPADHSGDTARTVKDTKKTPEKTAAEKKTAPTADQLAEKIGAVRSVTPKMRDRLITAIKRGDEIEKALLYAFGSLKGWRVGECRKIITATAM